jgi:uncharacterized RDD family membrane protein YckC
MTEVNTEPNADSWRAEVAARLEQYRTRRKPRTPRYPSLMLPFDVPETWSRPVPPNGSSGAAVATAWVEDVDYQANKESSANSEFRDAGLSFAFAPVQVPDQRPYRHPEQPSEPLANVIEFPRSAAIPVYHASDLADPVFDRPRIVEAPEILPPPPALGGMLIESTHTEAVERRAGTDFPAVDASQSASIVQRGLAAFVDGAVLALALAAFVAIFLRLNPALNAVRETLPLPLLAGALGLIAVVLGIAYEFLFVVYTGSTPGLRAARLQIRRFDGSPLNRRTRRWRVLASFLSAFSAGLGYLWCTIDQDGLCWHDRITRTHVQLVARKE